MKLKEVNEKIDDLTYRIHKLKVNANSGYPLSTYDLSIIIHNRNEMKKELSHLLRVQKLQIERKEKLKNIKWKQ